MAWLLSAMTIWMTWLMGNKSVWGPRVGVLNQLLWFVYILSTQQYGLMPCCLLLAVVQVRNCFKWREGKV